MRIWLFAAALVVLAGSPSPASPPPRGDLGEVRFPVSGRTQPAREHFLRGLLALHSFFYDEALDEFRAAASAEPGFAMALWGQAMAHNHTIWEFQDLEAGRKALAQVPAGAALSERERALLAAVRILYGAGERPARSAAYAAEMERLRGRFPDDDEITALYALALLGTLRPGPQRDEDLAIRMKAGALSLEVLGRNPSHPGAAHYTIHSFDDPIHAILALPAARRYAQIAPEAFHARHMPAHIFVQLGMWQEATASCESAWAASLSWIKNRKHPLSRADYHSLSWLVSLHLQTGRRAQAEEVLRVFQDAIRKENAAPMRMGYVGSLVPYLVTTSAWERAEGLLAPLARPASLTQEERAAACHPDAGNAPPGVYEGLEVLAVRAYAAAARGDEVAAQRLQGEARALGKRLEALPIGALLPDQHRQQDAVVRALLSRRRGKQEAAARAFLEAGALDEKLGGNWFADPGIVPWEEEAGLAFVDAGKGQEAGAAFATSLRKRPGRTRSLLGAARAAEIRGDRAAAALFQGRAQANQRRPSSTMPQLLLTQ